MTKPDRIHWCTGSDEEWTELTEALVSTGTFTQLNPAIKPNSFYAASDPIDVARVEDRTYICSVDEKDCGPTNNWMAPDEMKALMRGLYEGCMAGPHDVRHPVRDGPPRGREADVRHRDHRLRLRHRLDARDGPDGHPRAGADGGARRRLRAGRCTPSATRSPRARPTSKWPCNDTKYIVQFPEERAIWSYGSGYGGNALLGKKCYALRIASVMARDEGWLAEHMLILKLTSPEGTVKYIAAAFPSACGKTNLAMLEPTIPGWKVETLGDDIAWMRIGEDGRLWAVNPEYGFFGVAPGTNEHTNPNAMKTINKGNSVFTNVALTEDGDIWWEGLENPPAKATSWKGEPWTPDSEELSSHPNSRYCTPIKQCDILAPEYDDPRGVPIDAILFGGRRKTTVPAGLRGPRLDARHLPGRHAVQRDHRRRGRPGRRRAPRPDGDAAVHRLQRRRLLQPLDHHRQGERRRQAAEDLLRQLVPPRRRGRLPVARLRREQPGPQVGRRAHRGPGRRGGDRRSATCRRPDALDTDGLDMTEEALEAALAVDAEEWKAEIPQITEWFEKFGDQLPTVLWTELDGLKARLGV